mgnify:CR=1 FL=1
MSDEKKQLSKARQALVDRVLSRLDTGAMPWDNGMQGVNAMPFNAVSGARYRGMNALTLMLTFKQDPRWLTFNQAKDKGYTVKKGAKGVPIELYKTIDKRTGKDADIPAILEEIKDMTFTERQEFKRKNLQSFARGYYVFNASDVIGIEPYRAPELTPADVSARNERIERVIADSVCPIVYDGNGRNYYSPSSDDIHLTDRAAFKSDEFFYNTTLHEMAHSTGHNSRLDRKSGAFGSKAYAREELVAELSSVLIAAELGLDHSERVIENSAEYVRSWAKDIRENPQTLIDAAFDASKATDYICDRERQRERTAQPQEKTQKESLQSSVKEWYSRQYPTDELASSLNEKATFGTVRDALMSGKDVYSELGNDDSVMRERVFGKLADVLDVSYKSVYDAWIEHSESAETRKERQERVARQDFPKDFADDGFAERTPPKSGTRATQTVQLRMTEAEAALFNDFLDGWNDKANEMHEIIDFGVDRPTSGDFWKGLEMLGDVDRSNTSYRVKFDRSRAHSFTIGNISGNVDTVDAPPEQHKKPLMVNFYAGPSSGKTTAALELTAALKKAGYNVEYISEYAKELVLEYRTAELNDQKHVTDEQYRRFDRIRTSTDVIVTDSPVLLGLVYGDGKIDDEYAKQIRGYYDSFDNFNMLMTRPKDATFQTEGRVHDEKQSIALDGKIKSMLDTQNVFYGSYKRDDIAKTVERIGQTYARLYGEQIGKTQKESNTATPPAPPQEPYKFKTNLDNIPDTMKALPNWVAFRTEQVDGKIKKILLSPNKGASDVKYLKWAKSDDPSTWATFDKAVAFARHYKLDGLAFAMSGSGMTCIDLDHHLDENGKPSALAQQFIDAAQGTYIEKSVSGRGLHIFYAGNRPDGYQNRNIGLDLETYDDRRFISMTGNLYDGATKEINPPSAELNSLLKSKLAKVQQYVAPSIPLGMDDNALLDKIRGSKVAADFEALWRGQIITYKANGDPDHSTSDYKLCNILGFFSGGDVAQVERLIKASGLYRSDKPDKYYALTARNACAALEKVYTPPERKGTKKNGGKPNGSGGRGSSGR